MKKLSELRSKKDIYLSEAFMARGAFSGKYSLFYVDGEIVLAGILIQKEETGDFKIVDFGPVENISAQKLAALIGHAFRRIAKDAPDAQLKMELRHEIYYNFAATIFGEVGMPVIMRGYVENTREDISFDDWEEYKENIIQAAKKESEEE